MGQGLTATVLQVKAWALALEAKRLTPADIPEHARKAVQDELLARWQVRQRRRAHGPG